MLTQTNCETATCENCIYYAVESEDFGTCHYHAPCPQWPEHEKIEKEPIDWMPYTDWPLVMADDFCGKFESKQ